MHRRSEHENVGWTRSKPAWIVGAACLSVGLFGSAPADAAERPNIVLIMADDLGRELLSSYGGTSYRTPNLDGLAREGMRFENCYATPLCTPSRAMILTGRYSFRNYQAWGELPRNQVTFAQLLKDAGYATVFAGKWHLGGWDETPPLISTAGFDEHISFDAVKLLADSHEGRGNRYWGGTIIRNGEPVVLEGYGPDAYSDFVVDFMRRHRDGPFLAYYCMTLMHRPFHPTPDHPDAPGPGQRPPEEWLGSRGEADNFEAMLTYADRIVGKLLDTLDELELSERTIVVFTSDNGTDNKGEATTIRSAFAGQLVRGGKYFPTELGANVPLLVRWPGHIAAGATSSSLVDLTDVLPTLCDVGGAELPAKYRFDGRSLRDAFRDARRVHKPFIYTWGNFEHSSRQYKEPARHADDWLHIVRGDRWKLYSDGRMFDVQGDFLETAPVDRSSSPEAHDAGKVLETQLRELRASPPARW